MTLFFKKENLIKEYLEKIKEYDLLNNQIDKKNEREKISNLLKNIILSEIKSISNYDKKNPLIEQLKENLNSLEKK